MKNFLKLKLTLSVHISKSRIGSSERSSQLWSAMLVVPEVLRLSVAAFSVSGALSAPRFSAQKQTFHKGWG